MKKSLLLFVTLFVSIAVMGSPVTPDEARQKIAAFMSPRRAASTAQNPEALQLVKTSYYKAQDKTLAPSYYVFNAGQDNGYVIAAADDRIPAILGYSDKGRFDPDNVPDNMRTWLDGYNRQIEYLNSHPQATASRRTVSGEAIAPLLGPIEWDQTSPFNDLCPVDGKGRSLTGCVATAMAQLMYFWKYPNASTGTIPGYTSEKRGFILPDIKAGTAIDWDNMLPKYNGNETDAQKQAVANLMLMCGTAVKMDYTSTFSSAYGNDVANGLKWYFDYDAAIAYELRDGYIQADWNQRVYNELKAGRPVYYDGSSSGSGHAFIVDGYSSDDYFHINWGWNGSSNDYFLLSILDPNNNSGSGASLSSDGYSFGQGAIFGLQPNNGGQPAAPVLTVQEAKIFCDTILTRTSVNDNFKIEVGFSIVNNTGDTHTFDWGVGIFDLSGNLLGTTDFYYTNLPNGYGFFNPGNNKFSISLGKDITEGVYVLAPISREKGTSNWYADRGSDFYNVILILQDNRMRLIPPIFDLKGTLAATGKKEANSTMPFTATITNSGTRWKGELFFMLNGDLRGGRHFDIENGETKDITFSIVPDSVGKYEIAVCSRKWNGSTQKFEYTCIALDSVAVEAASKADLSIAFSVENAVDYIVKENVLKMRARVKNTGSAVYDNDIMTGLYKRRPADGMYYLEKTLQKSAQIEVGQTDTIPFDFENLEDEDYLFVTSYRSEGKWVNKQSYIYTVQTREPAPVPELSTSAKTANAVYENSQYVVKTDTAIVSVQVRNTGTVEYADNIIVKMFKLFDETSGQLVANVRTPIQLVAGRDTTITMEFPGLEDGGTYFYWTYYVANTREVQGSPYTPLFTVKLEEKGYYLVGNMNSWSTTDQSYPFTKLADGKTWEITFDAPAEDSWMKVAPASAYNRQGDDFWANLLSAPQDSWTEPEGSMVINGGAWLIQPDSVNAETYTMRIVPSAMTYQITYTAKADGIQIVEGQQGNVTIHDLRGNKLADVSADRLQQRLQSLPKGLYIVRSGKKAQTIRN